MTENQNDNDLDASLTSEFSDAPTLTEIFDDCLKQWNDNWESWQDTEHQQQDDDTQFQSDAINPPFLNPSALFLHIGTSLPDEATTTSIPINSKNKRQVKALAEMQPKFGGAFAVLYLPNVDHTFNEPSYQFTHWLSIMGQPSVGHLNFTTTTITSTVQFQCTVAPQVDSQERVHKCLIIFNEIDSSDLSDADIAYNAEIVIRIYPINEQLLLVKFAKKAEPVALTTPVAANAILETLSFFYLGITEPTGGPLVRDNHIKRFFEQTISSTNDPQ
eukprot:TRINITY_DN8612_c0_g1_i1.p2 TRINITY_DN8612_c0_g1~~TRINITY_DN8612_c0_g1_i1.p2  ORF type:complete len:274 (-),score=92.19 TRINITY_DN8612_c0_g1_i1:635-1456(-)